LKYGTYEDMKMVWMIAERNFDPQDSVFRLVKKLEKRGKSHPLLEKKFRKLGLQNLQAELTPTEFKHLFIVFFSYMCGLNPRARSYQRKFSDYLEIFIPIVMEEHYKFVERRTKKPRIFPFTWKDQA
jgi:hypothetical protein